MHARAVFAVIDSTTAKTILNTRAFPRFDRTLRAWRFAFAAREHARSAGEFVFAQANSLFLSNVDATNAAARGFRVATLGTATSGSLAAYGNRPTYSSRLGSSIKPMIALFTDFGGDDIYVAQLKAALLKQLLRPVPIIDLLHSVPAFDIAAGAHLLAALQPSFSPRTVFLAVVDPGVGTERGAIVVEADDQWFVGPDNGLLSVVAARATVTRTWRVLWRPPALSASFHGRDLFAPVAAWIASGTLPDDKLEPAPGLAVQLGAADRPNVIYVDHYGNALTGLRACNVPATAALSVAGRDIDHARVFADARPDGAFWYANSIGLVEIAANRASAAELLGVAVGDPVRVQR